MALCTRNLSVQEISTLSSACYLLADCTFEHNNSVLIQTRMTSNSQSLPGPATSDGLDASDGVFVPRWGVEQHLTGAHASTMGTFGFWI